MNKILTSKNRIFENVNGGVIIYDGTTGMSIGVSRGGLFNGFRGLGE
ncbi:hypothetical protein GCM10011378_39920 [Hymenobacter glacieicola]|uniref:Uncharacterized protein n=1 Tax=Hymenobacter glacieicola TaxID=1562124 RepID=A0ABQ1X4S5_9BACT|nr:hypothetical protein GCM10011378_39920 [Hymenobacter glacieicola]